jgi:hypothetical protein
VLDAGYLGFVINLKNNQTTNKHIKMPVAAKKALRQGMVVCRLVG